MSGVGLFFLFSLKRPLLGTSRAELNINDEKNCGYSTSTDMPKCCSWLPVTLVVGFNH